MEANGKVKMGSQRKGIEWKSVKRMTHRAVIITVTQQDGDGRGKRGNRSAWEGGGSDTSVEGNRMEQNVKEWNGRKQKREK